MSTCLNQRLSLHIIKAYVAHHKVDNQSLTLRSLLFIKPLQHHQNISSYLLERDRLLQLRVRHSHCTVGWFGLLPEQDWECRCQIAQYLLLSLFLYYRPPTYRYKWVVSTHFYLVF